MHTHIHLSDNLLNMSLHHTPHSMRWPLSPLYFQHQAQWLALDIHSIFPECIIQIGSILLWIELRTLEETKKSRHTLYLCSLPSKNQVFNIVILQLFTKTAQIHLWMWHWRKNPDFIIIYYLPSQTAHTLKRYIKQAHVLFSTVLTQCP